MSQQGYTDELDKIAATEPFKQQLKKEMMQEIKQTKPGETQELKAVKGGLSRTGLRVLAAACAVVIVGIGSWATIKNMSPSEAGADSAGEAIVTQDHLATAPAPSLEEFVPTKDSSESDLSDSSSISDEDSSSSESESNSSSSV